MSHRLSFVAGLCLLCGLLGSGTAVGEERESDQGLKLFAADVLPLLERRCFGCHSHGADEVGGGLMLDSRSGWAQGGDSGPVIVPGHPEESLLLKAVNYTSEDLQMPPEGRLSDEEIALLRKWITLGAPDPRAAPAGLKTPTEPHWAFVPPVRPPVPDAAGDSSPDGTPIDRFIRARLLSAGLSLAQRADRRTLIRRASFDLHGLPPTAAEVAAFEQDEKPGAWSRLLERLLASPRYGQRWGRYWLDVARYADTKGYVYSDREEERYVHAHPYRDWVVRAFNADLPYDRFVQLQLAADQLASDPADLAAMGFLTLGRRFLGVTHDIIDDRIDVVSRGLLGLSVACARCHDHKYDPIPTEDYYALYGVFDSSREDLVALGTVESPTPAQQKFAEGLAERERAFAEAYAAARESVAARLRLQVARYLAAQATVDELPSEEFYEILGEDQINPIVVRRWQSYLRDRQFHFDSVFAPWHAFAALPPGEFPSAAREVWARLRAEQGAALNARVLRALDERLPASLAEAADIYGRLFAEVFREGVEADSDEAGEELRRVLSAPEAPVFPPAGSLADTQFYFEEATRVRLGKLLKEIETWHLTAPGAIPYAGILRDRDVPRTPCVFLRGNPQLRGPEVPRQLLEVLAGPERQPFASGSGRRELAQAFTRQDNPLTARVLVNRVWLHHFGQGLVTTPSDFGTRSDPPSHPELLDWLAVEFMEQGWSLKWLQRLIMGSHVYQQGGREQVRSAGADATSPRPDPQVVDPENRLLWHFPRRRLDFEALRDSLLAVSGDLDRALDGRSVNLFTAPYSRRASIYGDIDRVRLPGVLRVFDVANPDLHVPQRHATTVPQQALFLLNSPFVVERAQVWADRLPAGSDEARIRHLYAKAFQRLPSSAEVQQALTFLRETSTHLPPTPVAPEPSPWSYGYGDFEVAAGVLRTFTEFPHFTGEAWQGGPDWPDAALGWLRLTATGGHPGDGAAHAVVRRWTAPRDVVLRVTGDLRHPAEPGDGVRATLLHSRGGAVESWSVHHGEIATRTAAIVVRRGEWLDFVVDSRETISHDDFLWELQLHEVLAGRTEGEAPRRLADASDDFAGPPESRPRPLEPWAALAQVLLLSNEFCFVD